MKMLDREEIISAVVTALEPLDYVHALWEAGSTAFGRIDQYSDIDLHAIVADGTIEDTFDQCDLALAALSEITERWRVAEPTWHGNSQKFYKLKDAPEFMLVDLALIPESAEQKWLQPEFHGTPRILIDREHTIGKAQRDNPYDHAATAAYVQNRIAQLEMQFRRHQQYVQKEILRGNILNAMHFYPRMTVAPLVELLRIKYDRNRYSWGLRYLSHHLPEVERIELEALNLVSDLVDLADKQQRAQEWIGSLCAELNAELVAQE